MSDLKWIDYNGVAAFVPRDFQVIPYFKAYELACQGTGVIKLDPVLQWELPRLRRRWGKPLVVNSGCRTPEHNDKIGGHPNSFHLTENPKYNTRGCAAVDISWRTWDQATRDEFVALAKEMVWNVGIADTFVHIDRGQDYGKPVLTFNY
tara:strand:+ start:2949 stop:3395 length:447 start_codon:yes stop_codon:yes gene_type:complete